ncbi:MAG: hypothetical protein ACLGH0_12880, partial [Thermoanaerobaculia bacterium]
MSRAWASFERGRALLREERFFDAIEPLREAMLGFREDDDWFDELLAGRRLVEALRKSKDPRAARATAEEMLARAIELGEPAFAASNRRDLALILADLGERETALRALEHAAEEARASNAEQLDSILLDLGQLARRFGRYEHAVTVFQEIAERKEREGDVHGHAYALSEIGYSYITSGEEARGIDYLDRAATAAEQAGGSRDAVRWRRQVDAARGVAAKEPASIEQPESGEDAYDLS